MVLGGGQHGGDDHGADTDRRALQGVVEVLAVDRDAVDQRGTGGVEGAALAERGAGAVAVPAVDYLLNIGLVARGKAEAGGIDQRSEEHTSELQSLMRISYAV